MHKRCFLSSCKCFLVILIELAECCNWMTNDCWTFLWVLRPVESWEMGKRIVVLCKSIAVATSSVSSKFQNMSCQLKILHNMYCDVKRRPQRKEFLKRKVDNLVLIWSHIQCSTTVY